MLTAGKLAEIVSVTSNGPTLAAFAFCAVMVKDVASLPVATALYSGFMVTTDSLR